MLLHSKKNVPHLPGPLGMERNFSGKMLERPALPQNRPRQLLLRLRVTTCHFVCVVLSELDNPLKYSLPNTIYEYMWYLAMIDAFLLRSQ